MTKETGVEITVFGFDTGEGMPAPADYRDLPYLWQADCFKMDQEKLKARLKSARLVMGPVDKTLSTFFQNENPPPSASLLSILITIHRR